VAALVAFDAPLSAGADSFRHRDGTPFTDGETALIASATDEEWLLAEALRGGPGQASDPDAAAVASLLRLADGTGAAPLLVLRLRRSLVHPGGRYLSR
jgi:hypothetical protein